MYTVVICEDNILHLADLQKEVAQICKRKQEEILCFSNTEDVQRYINTDAEGPHLFLLDIQLGTDNGIHLAKEINNSTLQSAIIYITGFINFAPEVYETKHEYFILKKNIKSKLPLAIQKAEHVLLNVPNKPVLIQYKRECRIVAPEDIFYLEKNLRKTTVCCENERIDTYQTFSDLMEMLPKNMFIQCHKSFIINLACVKQYSRHCFIVKDDIEIPISRKFEVSAKQSFMENFMI